MGDVGFGKWRFIGGGRLESDTQRVTTFDLFRRVNQTTAESLLHSTDLLPSVNVIYRLASNVNLRGAYSQTLNRPEFRELAPFDFTDVVGGRSVVGNPDLERARIANYDIRWEWFPSPEDLLSVSFFFKDFDKPIERIVEPTAQLRTSFLNADGAQNLGAEIDFRRNLGFLAEALAPFSANFNYTYVNSNIDIPQQARNVVTSLRRPLEGQSRHVFNGILEYQKPRWHTTARLLFNFRGRRITDVGALGLPDIYEESYPRLDAVLIKSFGESGQWGFKIGAENVLNREILFTQGGQRFRAFSRGRSYSAGLSYSLF